MLRVMPGTGGRGAGEGGQNLTGAVEAANRRGISPIQVEPHPWRAVCAERCLHGSGRGGWKRAVFLILPGRDSLTRQVRTASGTSLATYFMKVVGEAPTGRSIRLIVTEHGIS
jgi:hypothetical protein